MNATLITAHSGCDLTPDNSLEFIEYALKLPIDCLEVDVRRLKNGDLVLSHNETEGNVPTLNQAFERLKMFPNVKLNCDLKEFNLEFEVLKLAKEYGVANQLIYSGSVSLNTLERNQLLSEIVDIYLNIEMLITDFKETLLNENYDKLSLVKTMIGAARKAVKYNITCLNLSYQLCVPELIEALESLNLPFSAWTPDSPKDIKKLCEAGAYNITTRSPETAIQIRDGIFLNPKI